MVDIDTQLRELLQNKNILVTGGTGSIGSEIVKKLLEYHPKTVRILSNSENELFQLQSQLTAYISNTRYLVGDVRDKGRLLKAMKDIDFVFHAAALKHVPLCEYNPFEAVLTNVIGTNNILEAAAESKVKKVINISTDKAVNPVNTMGACKLLGEKIVSSTARFTKDNIFYSVRFGNVLGSRGSIVPIIRDKILRHEPIPITHEDMTRFIMTIPDAVKLVIETMLFANGGEIFVLKMKKVKIIDLIKATVQYICKNNNVDPKSIELVTIGKRPGEKLSESLLTPEELEYSYETEDLIIIPPNPNQDVVSSAYKINDKLNAQPISLSNFDSESGPFLTKEDILNLLSQLL